MSETKTERKFNCLLSKYSELEKESKEIVSEFYELISDPSRIGNSQRCDELIDKYDDILLKSDDILDKLDDLTEALKLNDPRRHTFEIIVRNKRDALLEREDKINDILPKIIIKLANEKLQKLIEKEKTLKTNAKKETPKTNAKIKTAMYFGYIAMATLAYLMSKK